MAIEIERKFLVSGDFLPEAVSSTRIVQGYICSQPGRTVRIRIRGEEGFLTIKGASDEKGLSRYEFEQKIPLVDAERLLELCEPGAIDKVRYLVILAEIELSSEDEPFEKPAWLGKEVSGDRRYYNSMLTKHPFNSSNA